ncbi:ribbon-helix-helix protein, CopG family [Nocardioides carbamazepini]|uniref:ribbon-helix-helix protein, CopG family n=1 Tax=Nocardioides carbamazepini TaxID=2854259 RepID=UPI00214A7F9D|nr:ribbon-helix-helix protein, CopG family [Nocardioides carbamazepini]MCR1786671.1 ribbon-helix-helix protein, CopG family [Nocardioides carbamazepini]
MTVMAFTLRTDDELDAALAELAATQGLSKQEVVRRAVLDLHRRTQHKSRVVAASAASRERWGAVLDRLGSV